MLKTIGDNTTELIDAMYLTAGNHTARAFLRLVSGAGTIVARIRVAGSQTDEATLSSAGGEQVDTPIVVASDGWFEVWADITAGRGVVAVTVT